MGQRSSAASGVSLRRKFIEDISTLMASDLIDTTRISKYNESEFYEFMLSPGVLDYVKLEEMANIGLCVLLDTVASKVTKLYRLTHIQEKVGDLVEHQARMVKAQLSNPKFVDQLAERISKFQRTTKDRKIESVKLELEMLEQEDAKVSWDQWSFERKAVVGSWVLWNISRCLNTIKPAENDEEDDEILPWFKLTHQRGPGEKYSSRYIYITDEGQKQLDALDKMSEDISYQRLTMLIPPVPWVYLDEGRFRGGYLGKGPGQTKNLIHGPQNLIRTEPSRTAMNFLNNVQDQPWRINKKMYEIISYFMDQNLEIGPFAGYNKLTLEIPFISDRVMELPLNHPERVEQQKMIWQALQKQKDLKNKSIAPRQVLAMAEENLQYDQFYIPWFFDSRLRAYPLVTLLSPQGADYQKALLEFADGAKVTPDNEEDTFRVMLVAIATTWGNKMDKLPFDGRAEFAAKHLNDNLQTIIADPIGSYEIWSKADEPFQHLALLLEYHRLFIDPTTDQQDRICRVPIGYDATCSGLQLLGAFVRDEETCRLVNVTPSDKPQDAYAAVAEKARWLLSDPERWQTLPNCSEVAEHNIPLNMVDRKVAKKVVMLIPYGGQWPTLLGHVRDSVKSWGEELALSFEDTSLLTKALIAGMSLAVPGFSALNGWFKSAGKAVIESGKDSVQWRTATGSVIHQHYREPLTEQAQTFLVNRATYSIKQIKTRRKKGRLWDSKATVDIQTPLKIHERSDNPQIFKGWGDVVKSKNSTALAANWTHSQDAATLQIAFANFDLPFATVHDCVYAPAPVIHQAVDCIRRAFVTVVTWEALEEFRRLNNLALDLPTLGTADVTTAIHSEYLFS